MEQRAFSFEGLEVYQAARVLVRDIYLLQQKFPKTEMYALGDQIRRSASSVTSISRKVVDVTLLKIRRTL